MNLSRVALISLASLGTISFTPSLAHSAILNYTFTVNIDSGNLNGNTYEGSFSFDDSESTTEDFFTGLDTRSLNSFNFNFESTIYDDPTLGTADFDPDDNFIGLTYSDGDGIFSFGSDFFPLDVNDAFFTYDLSGSQGGGFLSFNLETPQSTTTPEPNLLIGLGLFSSVLLAKRKNK
ncbi:hypothetical protein A5482_014965 (plasmid) [Cyanobacterium sp. IPPAS B-1200]|uniref:hypothetical protein n=1 Tax=Cyanobacterium sp. IPPAS B-1200 TaxID=1562720 RepID=UPI0008526268|nr:hypothetical protein [Cyanobacterium sp. IPPAS B-1200]OEJ77493.1 hypothetical protein A5482_15410 [Cyanobacterium sp. IPPAS B-1200]